MLIILHYNNNLIQYLLKNVSHDTSKLKILLQIY